MNKLQQNPPKSPFSKGGLTPNHTQHMIRNALPFEKGELEGIFKIELDTPHLTLRNNISHGWGGFSNSQSGFTLIELMIALALGLVISAAAIMLFLTGQKSYSLQQGTADLQDNANFGLNYIVKDIRLSNLNTMTSGISDETAGGRIVFRSISNKKSITSGTPPVTTDYYNLPASLTGTTVAVGMLSQGNTGTEQDFLDSLKGNNGDIVDLDTPNNWSNAGQEQLDGVNYNVYTGTGTNSTIKLLIEDDIDVKPDI